MLLLSFIILILGIPVGFLIAWLARDELVSGRIWFKFLIILGIAWSIIFIVIKNYSLALTFAFIAIVSLISFVKSFDKKWTKKRA